MRVTPNFDFNIAYLTNLIENKRVDILRENKSVSFEYKPFKIYTIVVE